ncbi:MAG: hypothetical protein VB095_07265 [Anaerovorax sp.]|nr:hypothetical protein [Anaerovorax sp.]
MNIRIKRNVVRRYRSKKQVNQDQLRGLACLIFLGFLAGAMLYMIEPKVDQGLFKGNGKFEVVDGLEIHEEISGAYKIDALLPQIISDLKNTTDISAEIAADFYYLFDRNEENVAEAFSGWINPTIEVFYQVKRKNKVYDIAITTKVSSIYAYEPLTIVRHYFYDVKKQEVLQSKTE